MPIEPCGHAGERPARIVGTQNHNAVRRNVDAWRRENSGRSGGYGIADEASAIGLAAGQGREQGARIAFGRLKALRSNLERRFAEVDAFDEYVERGRSHA